MTVAERFFVACVKAEIKNESAQSILDCVDYKQLYKLCASHSMSVVVNKALETVRDKVPEAFMSAIEKSVQYHLMKDVQNEFDANTVLNAFDESQIKYMPLRGYHLKKLYPSTEMRYALD